MVLSKARVQLIRTQWRQFDAKRSGILMLSVRTVYSLDLKGLALISGYVGLAPTEIVNTLSLDGRDTNTRTLAST